MNRISPMASAPRSGHAFIAFLLMLLALAYPGAVRAQTPTVDAAFEYPLKAGFLLNFFKLIEWPASFAPNQKTYRLAIVDDERVLTLIANTLDQKRVGDRLIEVLSADPGDDLSGVHMVFIPRGSRVDPRELATQLAGKPVLIVGEGDDFVAAGGQVGLVLRGSNLRIQLNLDATRAVGLRPSAKLSTVAEIIRPKKP